MPALAGIASVQTEIRSAPTGFVSVKVGFVSATMAVRSLTMAFILAIMAFASATVLVRQTGRDRPGHPLFIVVCGIWPGHFHNELGTCSCYDGEDSSFLLFGAPAE
jgi:hypothetical protein